MALYHHVVKGSMPGESWTFGIYTTGAISLAAAQTAWLTAFGLLWSTTVDDYFDDATTADEQTTAEVTQATGVQVSKVSDAVTYVGASATGMTPFQCATAVSLRSALATRAGRGRFYLPSVGVAALSEGRLSAAAQGAIADAAQDMYQSLASSGLTGVLYSRGTHLTQTITSIDVGDVIDTQRRRRSKLIEARESRTI